jgi:hypothetical protein
MVKPKALLHAALLGALLAGAPAGLSGCRTSTADIERWTTTSQGPRKLVAVITHDKYPLELRVEAAMALVRMAPRSGRRIGILGSDEHLGLVGALESLAPAERARVVSAMVPRLEQEMRRPPPKGPGNADSSFPYKDAAFALLTHADGVLVASDENRKRLRAALTDWAMADFSTRMDETSQLYGVEQVLRYLGPEGVERLPEQIQPNAKKVDRMADLVADLGSGPAKLSASKNLVAIAKEIDSERWIQQKAPAVEAANKASKLSPTQEQFKAQLKQYQEEELLRTLSSMKKVGGTPVVEHLLAFAQNKQNSEQRRAAALAALEGKLDKNNPRQIQAVLEIAGATDTPDTVRDIALRRVGDLPRKHVINDLYALFNNDNWKIRWVAAELALKMSDTGQIDEFFDRLGKAKGLALTEPIRYGTILAEMKGPKQPLDLVQQYAQKQYPVNVRLSALGYWYHKGTPKDLPQLEPFTTDRTKIPECRGGADCGWQCQVGQELKEISTVSDFVQYCVRPEMERKKEPDKKEKKDK